jgi:hypothetical protein
LRHHSSVDVIFRRFIATFRRDKELNVVKITGCVPGGEVEAAGLMGVRKIINQSVESEFFDSWVRIVRSHNCSLFCAA